MDISYVVGKLANLNKILAYWLFGFVKFNPTYLV